MDGGASARGGSAGAAPPVRSDGCGTGAGGTAGPAGATQRPASHGGWGEVLNAIFSVLSTGCQWAVRPKDLPLSETDGRPKAAARRRRVRKGGCARPVRLRRGREGGRPQAPSPDRYHRHAARRDPPSGPRAGPRRRREAAAPGAGLIGSARR
ncbi:transposase [Elioraea sp. Yellowstone]|nr:transposase [Elioraea sp. Yellowstone]